MATQFKFLVANVWFFILMRFGLLAANSDVALTAPPKSPLYGKHLRVIWPNWEGNPKGLSGAQKGRVILEYLAARFQFNYKFVRVTEDWLEPNNKTRGQLTYLLNDEADFLMAIIQQTSERNKKFDLTVGYTFDAFAILIPVSEGSSANTAAVIKPFQLPIWLLLLISIVSVTSAFKFIQHWLLRYVDLSTDSSEVKEQQINLIQETNPYFYVFGNILSQGGTFTVDRLPIRLIAGTWCLAAFVFVQAYTSTLITYVVAPTNYPLVNSFNDLAEKPDVNIALKKFGNVENMLTTSDGSSKLLNKLKGRDNNVISCLLKSDCINLVKPGTKNVYIETRLSFLAAIKQRFDETKKCDIEIIDYGLMSFITVFALQKNSPYTSTINKGLTELIEYGILNYWETWFRPIPPQCTPNVKGQAEKEGNRSELSRLSLKNLTGAFVVFFIGIGLSFVVFIYEHISALLHVKKNPISTMK